MVLQNIEMYILLFFTYSFAGWLMESIGGIINIKKFVNRGFLIGPYCPVYGVGVVIITLLLGKYVDDLPVLFVLSTVICGTLEYSTSYIMEKLFNARWWDYHNRKFNINGRICLETLLPFGIAATLILSYINPLLFNIYNKLPTNAMHIIVGFLSVIFIVDFIISFVIISSFKGETHNARDNTEQISEMVKDKTEDAFMKAESNVILLGRKLKLKTLKFEKKVRYTRKALSENTLETMKMLANKVNNQGNFIINKISEGKETVENKIKLKRTEFELKGKEKKQVLNNEIRKRKEKFQEFQKVSKEKIDNTIKNIKISSEEITKQVIENFSKKSVLKNRLMEAFPTLEVKFKKTKKDKDRAK